MPFAVRGMQPRPDSRTGPVRQSLWTERGQSTRRVQIASCRGASWSARTCHSGLQKDSMTAEFGGGSGRLQWTAGHDLSLRNASELSEKGALPSENVVCAQPISNLCGDATQLDETGQHLPKPVEPSRLGVGGDDEI